MSYNQVVLVVLHVLHGDDTAALLDIAHQIAGSPTTVKLVRAVVSDALQGVGKVHPLVRVTLHPGAVSGGIDVDLSELHVVMSSVLAEICVLECYRFD